MYTLNDFSAIPGKGIRAHLEGRELLLGNPRLMNDHQIPLTSIEEQMTRLSGEGKTPMLVAIDQQIAGIIAVADTVKETLQMSLRH